MWRLKILKHHLRIKETHKIKLNLIENKIYGLQNETDKVEIDQNQEVSMNLFGFRKTFVNHLKNEFEIFLNSNINHLTKEFLLPEILNSLIDENKNVYVNNVNEEWFGITFKGDKPDVIQKINRLIKQKKYPVSLW